VIAFLVTLRGLFFFGFADDQDVLPKLLVGGVHYFDDPILSLCVHLRLHLKKKVFYCHFQSLFVNHKFGKKKVCYYHTMKISKHYALEKCGITVRRICKLKSLLCNIAITLKTNFTKSLSYD
jgi:hypothetical protein